MGESNENERSRLIAWLESKMKRAPIAAVVLTHAGRTLDRFEMEVGELADAFAARLWVDLEADADVVGSEGPVVYMLHLFGFPTEGTAEPVASATRPIRVHPIESGDPSHFGGDSDRAQSYRHSERYAQIISLMSQGALDAADRRNDRLEMRLQRIDDQRWEDLQRARQTALDQSELELKKEEARMQTLFMEKAFEQLELLAPLFLSKIMGSDETPGGAVERRMLKDFLATLDANQRATIFELLDPVQRISLGALAQGDVDPKFETIAIVRIMASLTADQIHAVYDTCQTLEQKAAFERILAQQKKGLAYAAQTAKALQTLAGPNGASS